MFPHNDFYNVVIGHTLFIDSKVKKKRINVCEKE